MLLNTIYFCDLFFVLIDFFFIKCSERKDIGIITNETQQLIK